MQLTADLFFGVSLSNASWPTTKAIGCKILFYMVLYSVGSRYISQEKQVGYELV